MRIILTCTVVISLATIPENSNYMSAQSQPGLLKVGSNLRYNNIVSLLTMRCLLSCSVVGFQKATTPSILAVTYDWSGSTHTRCNVSR